MRGIRSKGTRAEINVIKIISSFRYKYILYDKKLPGKPDIIFPHIQKIIFVNGCFWHQHTNCNRAVIPKTNQEYWIPKLEKNMARDKKNYRELKKMGFKILIIWECETKNKNLDKLNIRIKRFLIRKTKC